MIKIIGNVSIDERELSFTYSRSPGPGGQNVNKTATKATLWFDVMGSPSLTTEQRARVRAEFRTRMNRKGVLRVMSWRRRTQAANRRDALDRFVRLLGTVLAPRTARKKTRPSRAARELRLREKRRRSGQKRARSERFWDHLA